MGQPAVASPDRAALERLRSNIPDSVRFGTSTWNYPGWHGLVYQEDYGPKGAAAKMLREYAAFPLFGTVGIDANGFANRLDEFFSALPRDAQYAVEVRNDDFLTPMYFAVLREHGVAHVLNSWTRMPPIGHQLDLPNSISGPFILARALLRPGRTYDEAVDAFAPYDRIQDPNLELRRDLLRLIDTAVRTRIPAYLLVNNRAEGSSPLTVAEVARLLPEPAA